MLTEGVTLYPVGFIVSGGVTCGAAYRVNIQDVSLHKSVARLKPEQPWAQEGEFN